MSDNSNNKPSKTSAQYHSVKGTLTEALGNITGSASLQQSGQNEHSSGETEYQAARGKGFVEGTTDRAIGNKDAVVGAVTGDKEQQAVGNAKRDKGQTQQQVNS